MIARRSPSRTLIDLAIGLLSASLLAACGGAATPEAKAPADEPASGLVITETAALPWKTYSDPISGFSVAMPGDPKIVQAAFGKPGGDVRSFVVSDRDPRTPDFEIDRFLSGGAAGPADPTLFADIVSKDWKKGVRREKKDRHGIATIELWGESPDGKIAMSVAANGTFLYVLSVTGAEKINEDLAERFFDSLRLETPWHIETFALDSFTVAMPAPVAVTVVPPRDNAEIYVYYLKGEADLWIGVTLFSLTEERVRSASLDDILDDGVRGLARGQGVTIDKVTPYEHHGLHGREIMHTTASGQAFRSRMFVVGHRGYHVSVSSKTAGLVTQETASRVLDSMRIGARP